MILHPFDIPWSFWSMHKPRTFWLLQFWLLGWRFLQNLHLQLVHILCILLLFPFFWLSIHLPLVYFWTPILYQSHFCSSLLARVLMFHSSLFDVVLLPWPWTNAHHYWLPQRCWVQVWIVVQGVFAMVYGNFHFLWYLFLHFFLP